jgi:hypothetical protein
MIRYILALSLLCVVSAPAAARAEHDEVQFFSNIHVGPDSTIHDAVCFSAASILKARQPETWWSSSGIPTLPAKPSMTW